ncbi:hypothetical protein D3C81_1149990 [compost metagenome]
MVSSLCVNASAVTTIFAPTSFKIEIILSSGLAGSSGRYAQPAFIIPRIAMILSSERSNRKATISPG